MLTRMTDDEWGLVLKMFRESQSRAGAVEPVSRTRYMSLIAAGGLIANRLPASRAELPPAITPATRLRGS